MPRQPEIHFRLKPKNKLGTCSIYLQFIYNRRRLFYAVGQSIKPGDWYKNKERVKNKQTTTADGKYSLNELLDSLEAVCSKCYYESLKNGIPEPQTIKAALDNFLNQNVESENNPALFTFSERFINGEIRPNGLEKKKSTLQNYSAMLKHMREYAAFTKSKVDFETITLDFFYSYINYLQKEKKLSHNSVSKDISILKVIMGEAVDMGFTNNMQFRHKKFSFNEVETEQVYLSELELDKLNKFVFTDKKLEQVRDLFIFGAWVGLRFSDFSNIKPENIIQIDGDNFIKIKTKKTKEVVIIPCNPVVLDIFKKYAQNPNRLPRSYSNQKFNDYIKDVCKEAEMNECGRLSEKPEIPLWKAISSHTARRSFATNYYLQGFPTIDLMKITGHKTEKAFLLYIKVSKLDTAKRLSAHIKKNWSEKMLRIA